ncbi:MAG: single-stranded-DNA-specific exonuclease RecJ [Dehalococcoidales bacterium]|nr:single-stranded-DNA-specific exonuclease RecJ [Dehalococcoidales bacterium]
MNSSRWNVLPPAPAEYFAENPNLSPLIAQILYNRGLTEPTQLASFIAADKRLSADPFLIPDMHQAVTRTYRALLSGENIAIYGDFDTDGITAAILLVQGISRLGGKVVPYLPHRLNEGHGVKTAVLEKLCQQGISLVITVDCGITALAEVKKAQRKGLDIIITDHHTPPDNIPPAVAVVNPKLPGSQYPFLELAGVGVAFKFLQALLRSIGKEEGLDDLLDLVALGTIADVMPLVGENRYLVKQGLRLLNTKPRTGIREMANQASLTIGSLNAESVSWVIAPRLNTTGRLGHAMPSYQLLITDSAEEARQLSLWLEQKNTERQRMTSEVISKARDQILAEGIAPILIASDEEFPAGVIGLAAGRLREEFYRPAVVIKTGKQTSIGSCRSIPEFNITQALHQCQSLLSQFGGHPQAAGFTLPTRDLPRLKEALLRIATTTLAGIDLRPHLDIDAEVTLAELAGDTFPSLQKLAPFGKGNPAPTFISRKLEVTSVRVIGNKGAHLNLKLRQGGSTWDGIAFHAGNYLKEATSLLDIVYNLEVDSWCGSERLRLNILDFAPVE